MMTRRATVSLCSLALVAACGPTPQRTAIAPATIPDRDITQVLAAESQFSRFIEALSRGQLLDGLRGAGPVTVFAPTNDAWGYIPINIRNDLLPMSGSPDIVRLQAVLNGMIVRGEFLVAQNAGRVVELTTRNGNRLRVDARQTNAVTVDGLGGGGFGAGGASIGSRHAGIIRADIRASNGVVHVIDRALLP
jgi:uncharacterized surface protein with fasciclin (FAS1) repeats